MKQNYFRGKFYADADEIDGNAEGSLRRPIANINFLDEIVNFNAK